MTASKLFRVVDGPLKIRALPNTTASFLKQQLQNGEQITVTPESRTVNRGYIWWQHSLGWSAEGSENKSKVFMQEVVADAAQSTVSVTVASSEGTVTTTAPAAGTTVTVTTAPAAGTTVTVTTAPAAGTMIGPVETDVVTLLTGAKIHCPLLFQKHPVMLDQTTWFQYFGNTPFAFNLSTNANPSMQRMYFYCQALHGGVDYGNSKIHAPILAGVNGVVEKVELGGKSYSPNFVRVKVGADWTIVYGHMGNVVSPAAGQAVTPDTPMGEIEGTRQHLHLEVRYKNTWIINPLLFMPVELRTGITNKFSTFAKHFFSAGGWNQWLTPYDQPVLKLSAPDKAVLMGPRVGR